MKENKFKVGDRVAVYTTGGRCVVTVNAVSGNSVWWADSDNYRYSAHFKQCRRLIPKKKKPGDEIWIAEIDSVPSEGGYCWMRSSLTPRDGWLKYKRCR